MSPDSIVFFDIKRRLRKSGSFFNVMLNSVQHLASWTYWVRSPRIRYGAGSSSPG
jgi:hypothetical protein